MRVVVSLSLNTMLRRDDPPDRVRKRQAAADAARILATLAADHELAIAHDGSPLDGLLAIQSGHSADAAPEKHLLVASLLEQALAAALAGRKPCVTATARVEVDQSIPTLSRPTTPIGPRYSSAEAARLAQERGWQLRPDGDGWRRTVPAATLRRILDLRPLELLLASGAVLICVGLPVHLTPDDDPTAVETVLVGEQLGALLAEALTADRFLILTDAEAVYEHWGTPQQRALRRCAPDALLAYHLPAGLMGPKIEAACAFAARTGRRATIGLLEQAAVLLNGEAGTSVSPEFSGISYDA